MAKIAALLAVAAQLRDASAQLEEHGDETSANMRRHVEQALAFAPTEPAEAPSRDGGDFEPGTSIGGDLSQGDVLRENAQLQEKLAGLEQRQENERLRARIAELENGTRSNNG